MIKDAEDNGLDGNIMRVITAFPAKFRGAYKVSSQLCYDFYNKLF